MTDESSLPASSISGSVVAGFMTLAGVSGHPGEAIGAAVLLGGYQPYLAEQLPWLADVARRVRRRFLGSDQSLQEELMSSPAKQELLIRALDVARLASTEEKRRAIAASLVEGFESDLNAARENDVLRAIADLDLAHVLALEILSKPRVLQHRSAYLGDKYLVEDLAQIEPGLFGLGERVTAVLVSQGLASNETSSLSALDIPMDSYRITDFGRLILERFNDVELDS
jgi:hypothetical protein